MAAASGWTHINWINKLHLSSYFIEDDDNKRNTELEKKEMLNYQENRKIVQVPKNKISIVIPEIFYDEINVLKYLPNDKCVKLRNDLRIELNDFKIVDRIVKKVAIEYQNQYYGQILFQFELDQEKDDYLNVTCLTQILDKTSDYVMVPKKQL